jgi:hypothetical protein
VFDGARDVGRIYRLTDQPDSGWFWDVSFQLTGRKSYGHAPSLDGAKAARSKAEYGQWQVKAGVPATDAKPVQQGAPDHFGE